MSTQVVLVCGEWISGWATADIVSGDRGERDGAEEGLKL